MECLIEKIDGYKKNPKNLFIAKVGENIPTAFLMSSILSFKSMKKAWWDKACMRDKACMKRFGESFRQYAMDIIKVKKKSKMKLVTKEQQELYENA